MAALAKGFREMHALGLASHVPRMLGTQAVGADPITQAWEQKADGVPTLTDATTIADSICVGRPANGLRCLQAINETEGAMISVDDDATMEAARVQARLTGIFGEPAAANATAGLWEARRRRIVGINETAVIVVSGNGLKDSATAAQAVGDPLDVAPTLDAVGEIIDSASD
jgi:threonine synthase